MAFEASPLEIPGLLLIKPGRFSDERGFLIETYRKSCFEALGIFGPILQENHSKSARGVLRGLHYQIHPSPQGKLVRVSRGEIFDVSVDIRVGSPYYGKWSAVSLSENNRFILWIPPGFAHGFMAVADETEVLYCTTSEYAPSCERGILWNDPALAIAWPALPPLMNERDRNLPPLDGAENTFIYGG
jgi:dTDP-4-dehydrorhamnose 3,5-epimerase